MENEIKTVKKVWGHETWIRNDEKYCMKELFVKQAWQCSLHRHPIKEETFDVVEGRVILQILEEDGTLTDHWLCQGSYPSWFHIKPMTYHRFIGLEQFNLMVECSTFHSDEDVERLEPSGPADCRKYWGLD